MKTDVLVSRTVFSLILLVFFLGGAFFNFRCLWLGLVRKVRAPSMAPLMGGIVGAVAFFIFPFYDLRRWAWVPLIVDPGCAPLMPSFLLVMARETYRSTPFSQVASFRSSNNQEACVMLTLYKDGACALALKRGTPYSALSRSGKWARNEDRLRVNLGDKAITYIVNRPEPEEARRLVWSPDSDPSGFDNSELMQTTGKPF